MCLCVCPSVTSCDVSWLPTSTFLTLYPLTKLSLKLIHFLPLLTVSRHNLLVPLHLSLFFFCHLFCEQYVLVFSLSNSPCLPPPLSLPPCADRSDCRVKLWTYVPGLTPCLPRRVLAIKGRATSLPWLPLLSSPTLLSSGTLLTNFKQGNLISPPFLYFSLLCGTLTFPLTSVQFLFFLFSLTFFCYPFYCFNASSWPS